MDERAPAGVVNAAWRALVPRPSALRRGSDRFELVIRWAVLLLVLVLIPVVLAYGSTVAGDAERRGAAARATRHAVTATVVAAPESRPGAPVTVRPDGAVGRAPVRWSGHDGSVHVDRTTVAAGARPGDTAVVWVDRTDHVTTRPPQPGEGSAAGAIVALLALLALLLGAVLVNRSGRRLLDRGRLRAWEREWEIVGRLGRGSAR